MALGRQLSAGSKKRTLNGTLHRTSLPPVPPRGDEALPQGGALLHREVRDREAQLPARAARQDPEGEARRLRPAAARKTESQTYLRGARGSVPRLLRGSGAHARDHRRDAPAAARTAARQRRLPPRAVDVAAAGAA